MSQIQIQINIINNNPNFVQIINNIIDDMLMGRVSFDKNNKKISLHINKSIFYLISDWYLMTNSLPPFKITVYRGVKNMSSNEKVILQPIPFSTSIKLSNAFEWINNNDDQSFIMKINVSKFTRFSVTGNYAEGNELVLPAGYLKMNKITFKKHTKIISYSFIPFSFEQMINNFDNLNFIFEK